jgi:hypothetical protein
MFPLLGEDLLAGAAQLVAGFFAAVTVVMSYVFMARG